jgi:hypothetical protein
MVASSRGATSVLTPRSSGLTECLFLLIGNCSFLPLHCRLSLPDALIIPPLLLSLELAPSPSVVSPFKRFGPRWPVFLTLSR